jgi:hypothetical protein
MFAPGEDRPFDDLPSDCNHFGPLRASEEHAVWGMTSFITRAHKEENPCSISLLVSFIQSSSILSQLKPLDRSVQPQSIPVLV